MNRLLTIMAVGLAGIQGITLNAETRPKLVVAIAVDQLRTDYLENLKEMMGSGGFRRLMENGTFIKDLDYNVLPENSTVASAIVQTGTYPRYSGITGEQVFDRSSKSLRPVFQDEGYIGNFTSETYSPAALRATTISDEIAIETKGDSKIHSIAPDASEAIVLAGHAGNSAFWVNENTGRWSSTTFYPNPPAALQNNNYNNPLVSRLDTMKWIPLRKNEPYPYVSSKEIKEGFKFSFPRSDRDVYAQYKLTPYVNKDITDAAIEYIRDLNLGKSSEGTDVLNLAYTLSPYPQAGSSYRYPLEDAYLRLDRDLENLFRVLDKNVGKENVLVYLYSTGYFEEPTADMSAYRLPGGSFSVKRALSLLNAFLSAKYGNGSYVDQYHDGHFYLSEKTIEEKGLDRFTVANEARDFLMKMSGVGEVYTRQDLSSPALRDAEKKRLLLDPKNGGDLIVEFTPGWTIVNDNVFPPETKKDKSSSYLFPAFIAGSGIAPKVVEERVEAVSLAPTIARKLNIRAPNSANSPPLIL